VSFHHPTSRHLLGLAAVVAGVYLLASHLHGRGLRVNWTDSSQPPGLYRGIPLAEQALRRHQLVLVVLPPEIATVGRERGYLLFAEVGKCVAALPGDWVAVDGGGITVNGVRLPGTAPLRFDSDGRPLPRYTAPLHRVRPGEVWLYSNHTPRSWDSRYFGPVPRDAVRGTLQPLLTAPRFPRGADGEPTCNWIPTDT
jgi:conjugative transfer signal peptidase TraF